MLGNTVTTFIKPKRPVNVVFIHCSATSNPSVDAKTVNDWHVKDNGWSAIGYHYFITTNGTIQEGRYLERTPSAQSGYNTGSIAICLNGLKVTDFTEAQFKSLRDLCVQIDKAYGANKMRFRGHNEVAAKACPVFDYRKVLELDYNGYMKTLDFTTSLPSPPEQHSMKIERVTVSKTKNYKHPNVRIAQGLLIANDIDVGTIDGIAGNKFSQGIQIFQELNGIIPDGECGPKTWELLEGVGK